MAELAVGIIPLVAMAFKAFLLLRDLKSSYQNFDSDLKEAVESINFNQEIFKNWTDRLFSNADIPERARPSMYNNLDSQDSGLPIYDSILHETLGSSAHLVRQLICEITDILGEVEKLLSPATAYTNDFAIRNLRSVEIIQMSRLERLLRRSWLTPAEREAIPRRSSKRKPRRLQRKELSRLQELSRKIDYDVKMLERLLNSVQTSPNLPAPTQNASNSVSMTDSSNQETTYLLSAQAASRALHRLISKALICRCHVIHLMLDARYETIKATANGSQLGLDLHPHFNFRLNVDDPGLPIHITFTSTQSQTGSLASISHCADREICKEVVSMGKDDVKLVTFKSDPGGFVLRHLPLAYPPTAANAHPTALNVHSPNFLTIQELIERKDIDSATLDQLKLAEKLSYTLIALYSSPWISGWSVKSIGFFETLEDPVPKFGHWTPYFLLSRHCQERPSTNNSNNIDKDLYSLGLILLQIGRWKILEGQDRELRRIYEHLDYTSKKLGPFYEDFVRKCLGMGTGGAINLQDDRKLKDFRSHLSKIQAIVQSFG